MKFWIPCQYKSRYLELGQLPPPPSSRPPSRSLLYPDLNQQALLDNTNIIYYLPGFCTPVSCGLAIDTPVPSKDHRQGSPKANTSIIGGVSGSSLLREVTTSQLLVQPNSFFSAPSCEHRCFSFCFFLSYT